MSLFRELLTFPVSPLTARNAVRLDNTPIKAPPSMRTVDIELYLFYFVEQKVAAWEKANTSENLSR
jgi:hypothetical protein